MRQTLGRVLTLHDAVTRAGFAASAIILALIAISFSYEVVARYFFGAPTSWANAFVAYFLCASIFLAAPELTRRRAHVAVTILSDRASPALRAALHRVILAAGAAACLLATWITANATADQIAMGIDTISAYPVPKWLVSVFIPYGMLSSGLYFIRDLVDADVSATPEPTS
jgi:TRAP-type C4-dicarboxylate transport system permease small subunit